MEIEEDTLRKICGEINIDNNSCNALIAAINSKLNEEPTPPPDMESVTGLETIENGI
jgi:hypothetical protein